jgi:hypothetical protein
MDKRVLIIGFLLAAPLTSSATCANFNRTLTVGMKGADVKNLQILLNEDIDTRVALSGPGSPGNESEYFGRATARALLKFQERFAADILTPAGLTHGNGVAGPRTRELLNLGCDAAASLSENGLAIPVLSNNITLPPTLEVDSDMDLSKLKSSNDLFAAAEVWAKSNPIASDTNPMVDALNEGMRKVNASDRAALKAQTGSGNYFSTVPVHISTLLPSKVWPGMIVRVVGFGFSGKDTVTINGQRMEVFAPSENGILLPFAIPENMKPGTYVIKIDTGKSQGETTIDILNNK